MTLIEALNITPIDSEIVLESLEKDYSNTFNVLMNSNVSKLEFNSKEQEKFYKILVAHNFFYNKNIPSSFIYNSIAFKASLKNSPLETIANFPYTRDLLDSDKEIIYKALKDNNIPVAYFSQEMVEDPYILNKLVPNIRERDFILKRLMNDKIPYYSRDEKTLLTLLNSKSSSIEEEIAKMVKDFKEKDTMSILELYALVFYAKKELNKMGIYNYKVSLFNYNLTQKALGLMRDKEICIFNQVIPSYNLSVEDLMLTLNHEMNHVIQVINVRNADINKDEDIDIYSKDMILSIILGNEYYEDNYCNISYEFDAEFRAYLRCAQIFEQNNHNEVAKYIAFNYFKETSEYKLTNRRIYKGKEYTLEDLFQEKLTEYLKTDHEFMERIKDEYPIIYHEYDIGFKEKNVVVSKKEMNELLDILNFAIATNNDFCINVYTKLLEKRLNETQDLDKLKELLNNDYNSKTRIIVDKLIIEYQSRENDTYFKYFKFNKTKDNSKR